MVVPDLDKSAVSVIRGLILFSSPVITRSNEVRLISAVVVVDVVDALLVRLEREVGHRATERPHLDCVIQTSRRERLRVLRIDS